MRYIHLHPCLRKDTCPFLMKEEMGKCIYSLGAGRDDRARAALCISERHPHGYLHMAPQTIQVPFRDKHIPACTAAQQTGFPATPGVRTENRGISETSTYRFLKPPSLSGTA